MSAHIPFHIQEDILKRLPVKSLVRFRSVSKAWKSLIESSEFIVAHSLRSHTQPQHLLLIRDDPDKGVNYASYIDDDALRKQRPVCTSPLYAKQLIDPCVIGSSQGLLCLRGSDPNSEEKMAVIWNPSIRKSIVVAMPDTPYVGFGVCPVTGDPKIVAFIHTVPSEVMVYTLSSGKWRILSGNLPTQPIEEWLMGVAADGFIYWRVGLDHMMVMSFDLTNESFGMIDLPDTFACYNSMSFDLTNESFGMIDLPDTLTCYNFDTLFIHKHRESLGFSEIAGTTHTIWMMEHGVQRSFTKLFAMEERPFYFTKNGVPIVLVTEDERSKLVVYEPYSEHNNVIEVEDTSLTQISLYKETLLLLGRSDCISY